MKDAFSGTRRKFVLFGFASVGQAYDWYRKIQLFISRHKIYHSLVIFSFAIDVIISVFISVSHHEFISFIFKQLCVVCNLRLPYSPNV